MWTARKVSRSIRLGPKHLFGFSFNAQVIDDSASDFPDAELLVIQSAPAAKRLSFKDGRVRYAPEVFPLHLAELSGTFEQYLAKFDSKKRSDLKRKLKKCGAEIREWKTPEELRKFHAIAKPISTKTYHETLLHNGLPDTPEYHALTAELAASDNVRAYTLHKDGQAIAFLYLPAVNNALIYRYQGYDPAFSELSPGTVLHLLAFEKLFAEQKFPLFNFTPGDGQLKKQLGTTCKTCCNLHIFRVSPKALAFIASDISARSTSQGLMWLLDALQLRQILRQLARHPRMLIEKVEEFALTHIQRFLIHRGDVYKQKAMIGNQLRNLDSRS